MSDFLRTSGRSGSSRSDSDTVPLPSHLLDSLAWTMTGSGGGWAMTLEWLDIDPLDPVWIGIAFAFGMGARALRLPPLVGFLLAGFLLGYFGAKPGVFLVLHNL